MKKTTLLILAIILLLLVVVFTLQNSSEVFVNLLFWETSSSLAIIFFCAFSLGILIAIFALLPKIIQLKRRLKEEKEKQVLHQTY